MVNYNNSLIYKIYCKDENIKECYIGSTVNFQRRMSEHKRRYKKFDTKVYKFIRQNGGIENFDFEIVAHVPCSCRQELNRIEGEYIKKNEYSLNMCVAGRTRKERYIVNKDKINEYRKEYREKNKDKIKEKTKEYHIRNKEKNNERNKIWREKNKDKLKEYYRNYYLKKKNEKLK